VCCVYVNICVCACVCVCVRVCMYVHQGQSDGRTVTSFPRAEGILKNAHSAQLASRCQDA
jgi:hypothetical protein